MTHDPRCVTLDQPQAVDVAGEPFPCDCHIFAMIGAPSDLFNAVSESYDPAGQTIWWRQYAQSTPAERLTWSHPDNGSQRRVDPCGLAYGHDGDCDRTPPGPFRPTTTICGLSLDDLPFVPSPEGMRPCAGCFDGDDSFVFEDVMFA